MAIIHRWPLTANANDAVGGLTTTNNGNVTFDATNGASFNGSTQYLSFTKNLSSMSFTLSVWAKFATYSEDSMPFGANVSNCTTPLGIRYYGFSGSTRGFYNTLATENTLDFNATNYPSTSFVLCTMTYNSSTSTLKVYRGSTLVTTKTGVSVSGSLPSSFSIGREGLAPLYFTGNLLDARIYDSALTDSDIAVLNSVGPNVMPPSYYAMLHIVDGWGGYAEIAEIEAYSGTNKMTLTATYVTSAYQGYPKEKLVDGRIDMTTETGVWCSAGPSLANQYLIVRSVAPFDSVRVYNGGGNNTDYCAKNIRILTQSATSDPAYNDANWVLQKTDTWPQTLAYYDNTVSFSGTANYFPQCV